MIIKGERNEENERTKRPLPH